MANNAANVTVSKPRVGGGIAYGPTTGTLPTSADATLPTGFDDVGYISDEGINEVTNRENESIAAWGGDNVANPQTKYEKNFTFTMLEALSPKVLKAVFGDSNVTGTALSTGISFSDTADELVDRAWIIDMIMNGKTLARKVIPSAKIISVDEVPYADGKAIGYKVTLAAHPVNGKYVNTYYKTQTP